MHTFLRIRFEGGQRFLRQMPAKESKRSGEHQGTGQPPLLCQKRRERKG